MAPSSGKHKKEKKKKKEKKLKKEKKKLKKKDKDKKLDSLLKILIRDKLKGKGKEYKIQSNSKISDANSVDDRDDSLAGPSYDVEENSKKKAPMTKEEWEKSQSCVRKVYDPETGRHRLIKGSGEVLEECVSRERHKSINKTATQTDGVHFQAVLQEKVKDL